MNDFFGTPMLVGDPVVYIHKVPYSRSGRCYLNIGVIDKINPKMVRILADNGTTKQVSPEHCIVAGGHKHD